MSGGLSFDLSVNLGNVITIAMGVIALALAWSKLGTRLTMLEYRVTGIEKTLEKLSEAITKFSLNAQELALLRQSMSAVETQLATMHDVIEGMRRGEGYITSPRRNSVTGEYPGPDYASRRDQRSSERRTD